MVSRTHLPKADFFTQRVTGSFQASHFASLLPEHLQLCKVTLWVWSLYPSAHETQWYCEASREKPDCPQRKTPTPHFIKEAQASWSETVTASVVSHRVPL